jgi:hypothetical protein
MLYVFGTIDHLLGVPKEEMRYREEDRALHGSCSAASPGSCLISAETLGTATKLDYQVRDMSLETSNSCLTRPRQSSMSVSALKGTERSEQARSLHALRDRQPRLRCAIRQLAKP